MDCNMNDFISSNSPSSAISHSRSFSPDTLGDSGPKPGASECHIHSANANRSSRCAGPPRSPDSRPSTPRPDSAPERFVQLRYVAEVDCVILDGRDLGRFKWPSCVCS